MQFFIPDGVTFFRPPEVQLGLALEADDLSDVANVVEPGQGLEQPGAGAVFLQKRKRKKDDEYY